jgi:hypothetical protein
MSIRTTRSTATTTFEVPRWITEATNVSREKCLVDVATQMDAHGTPVDLAIPLRLSTMVVYIALISDREARALHQLQPLKLECPLLPTMMWSCTAMPRSIDIS